MSNHHDQAVAFVEAWERGFPASAARLTVEARIGLIDRLEVVFAERSEQGRLKAELCEQLEAREYTLLKVQAEHKVEWQQRLDAEADRDRLRGLVQDMLNAGGMLSIGNASSRRWRSATQAWDTVAKRAEEELRDV